MPSISSLRFLAYPEQQEGPDKNGSPQSPITSFRLPAVSCSCGTSTGSAALAFPAHAAVLARFFKTGPGQYGEGDRFIGLRCRSFEVAKEFKTTARRDRVPAALEIHEERLVALVILVDQVEKADDTTRKPIYEPLPGRHPLHQQLGLGRLSAPQSLAATGEPKP